MIAARSSRSTGTHGCTDACLRADTLDTIHRERLRCQTGRQPLDLDPGRAVVWRVLRSLSFLCVMWRSEEKHSARAWRGQNDGAPPASAGAH
eukprot:scaffold2611_cov114-Isochrysis_galbana.AAC.1